MEIRSSSNYIWNIKEVLGQGATGAVYRGRHKRTGDVFAIKAFNQIGMMRPQDVRKREFEVLRKLNHENIVKIFDDENETRTQNEIIVMELCSGGSLFTLLEHPSNFYGFSEEQFKQVVKDVVAGMEHLREQGTVHRDLKPGNIMRCYKEDGSSLYKLTDFGAARELEEQEKFVSIYGTEEYLHPELYERGVLRKQGSNAFGASVDLWSIGVTFYHIATGQLPFRPFGGRQNRDTMYRITTEKKTGMISGVQKSYGGEIEWSDKLPEQTRLSQSLRDLITPVLAGVLESDPSKMMSFETFFQRIQDIMSRKVVDVYCVESSVFHKIYIKPEETFAKLQDLIAVHTGVSAAQQRFYFKYDEFKPNPMAPASTYPNTSDDEPLLVTGGEQVSPKNIVLDKIPSVAKMPDDVSLEADATVAKIIANCAYCNKRAVKKYVRSIKAMGQTAESILKCLKKEMIIYLTICREADAHHDSVSFNSKMCFDSQEHMVKMVESLLSTVSDEQKELKEEVRQDLKTIRDTIENKRKSISELAKNKVYLDRFRKLISDVVEGEALSEVLQIFSEVSEYDSFVLEVATYTKNIEDIYNKFRKDKHHRRLSYADEQNHLFDRKKVSEIFQKLSTKTEQCVMKRAEVHGQLLSWLNGVRVRHNEAENYQQRLLEMMEADKAHQDSVQTLQSQCQQSCNAAMKKLLQAPTSQPLPNTVAVNMPSLVSLNGFDQSSRHTNGFLKRLETELDALFKVTRDSSRTARESSQHLENLSTSLIDFCSFVNEDVCQSFEQLQEEAFLAEQGE